MNSDLSKVISNLGKAAEGLGWSASSEDEIVEFSKDFDNGQGLVVGFPADDIDALRGSIEDLFDDAEESVEELGVDAIALDIETLALCRVLKNAFESEGAGLREEKKWFSQEDEQLINRLNHPTFTADHIRDVLNNAGDSTSMALVCGFLEAVGCMNTVPTRELLYQDARKKKMIEKDDRRH